MAYTQAGLAMGHDKFGKPSRFIQIYGLPAGRPSLSAYSLGNQYQVQRILDAGAANGGIGGLNEGVDLVVKRESPRKGQVCVLKRIRVKPNYLALLKREIEILHVLKHPNIVGFVDGYIPANLNGQAHLVMEFCDRGNLRDLIRAYVVYNEDVEDEEDEMYLTEAFVWHVFEALASALAYIHHGVRGEDLRIPSTPKGEEEWPLILHRDIKPENIFLQSVPLGGMLQHKTHEPSNAASQSKDLSNLWNKARHIPRKVLGKSSKKPPNAATNGVLSQQPPLDRNISQYPRVVLADFVSQSQTYSTLTKTYLRHQGVCTQANEYDWEDRQACTGTPHWMSPELP